MQVKCSGTDGAGVPASVFATHCVTRLQMRFLSSATTLCIPRWDSLVFLYREKLDKSLKSSSTLSGRKFHTCCRCKTTTRWNVFRSCWFVLSFPEITRWIGSKGRSGGQRGKEAGMTARAGCCVIEPCFPVCRCKPYLTAV